MQCQAVVEGALRKIGRLASGRTPRPVDANDAFDALKGLYRSWVASGAFGRLRDVIPTTDYTAGENERVFRNQSDTLQITLPETVANWCCNPREYGSCWVPPASNVVTNDVRPPRDGAIVVIVDAFTAQTVEFIYNGFTKQWQAIAFATSPGANPELTPLALSDEAPLSFQDPEGLRACLAEEIADQFGADIPDDTQAQANRFRMALTSRFSMPRETIRGVFV